MRQHWRSVMFLHWPYPAGAVQARLPKGLTVDTFDGTAWVGLIPLLMDDVAAPGLPALPRLSRFPETNVRTYVRGPDGNSGIWFLSLDADRLPAVLAARAGYGLRYYWSSMSITRDGDQVSYRGRRRWPGPAGAHCDARVRFGAPYREDELTPFDHFLTARYRLYARLAGRLVTAIASHPLWPLRRAELQALWQDLVPAAGLSPPAGDPVVHASDGVRVRVGAWRPLPTEPVRPAGTTRRR